MPETTYSYSESDTKNGTVYPPELAREIQTSAISNSSLISTPTISNSIISIIMSEELSSSEKFELDAVINAHLGLDFQLPQRVEVHKTKKEGRSLFLHGFEFFGIPGGVSEFDFNPNEDREIEGAVAHAYFHSPGDKMDFEFWAPSGLGPPNPEFIRVGRNGCDVLIPPSGETPKIIADSTKSIPLGVFIKVRYHSAGDVNSPIPRIGVNVFWHV